MNWYPIVITVAVLFALYVIINLWRDAKEKSKRPLLTGKTKAGPLESAFIEMQNGWELMTDEQREAVKKGTTKLFKGYGQTGTLKGAMQKLTEDEKPKEEPSKKDPELFT